MENSFCGLYFQKSKTNITELPRKEGRDRNRRYQQNATSCFSSHQISCVNKITLLKQKSARAYLQLINFPGKTQLNLGFRILISNVLFDM